MNINPPGFLIVIAGPTAVGKTTVALRLAKHYHFPIISADSRQFYREMKVGTARPEEDEIQGIRYYLSGHLSVQEPYNVSMFEKDALGLLEQLFPEYSGVLLCGGSGLFIDAVCSGMDELPDPDPGLRAGLKELLAEEGIRPLQEKLKELDPDYYSRVDVNNPVRLLRAIEVCTITGIPYSQVRGKKKTERPFEIIKIGLNLPRQELNDRINRRTDAMIREGFLEEARRLYPFRHLNALNTVGYKELFDFIDNRCSLDQAIVKIKTRTRRYAKRQMTWFSRDAEYQWFRPDNTEEIISFIDSKIKV